MSPDSCSPLGFLDVPLRDLVQTKQQTVRELLVGKKDQPMKKKPKNVTIMCFLSSYYNVYDAMLCRGEGILGHLRMFVSNQTSDRAEICTKLGMNMIEHGVLHLIHCPSYFAHTLHL